MDFSKLDTAVLAEDGSSMVICFPSSETPILDSKGKPSLIKMRGPQSPVMKSFARDSDRQALKSGIDEESSKEFAMSFALAATLEFVNVPWEDKPLSFTRENAKMLFGKHEFIVAQMLNHFKNGDNFLPKPPKP